MRGIADSRRGNHLARFRNHDFRNRQEPASSKKTHGYHQCREHRRGAAEIQKIQRNPTRRTFTRSIALHGRPVGRSEPESFLLRQIVPRSRQL